MQNAKRREVNQCLHKAIFSLASSSELLLTPFPIWSIGTLVWKFDKKQGLTYDGQCQAMIHKMEQVRLTKRTQDIIV